MSDYIFSDNNLEHICDYIINGNSIIDYCKIHDIKYGQMINWLYDNDDRKEKYEIALVARGEWTAQRILQELRQLSFVNAKDLFNDDGSIRDVDSLPDSISAAIEGIDIQDAKHNKDGDEIEPRTRKIKLTNKLNAIKLLGTHLKMFSERHDHTVNMKLEELVKSSLKDESEEEARGI